MNDKRKIVLTVMLAVAGVLVVFGAIVGLTYAYFTANVGGNQNASSIEVNTARLATVQFTDSALINIENMLPGTSVTKTFSVSMNGQNTIDMSYQVFMYWKNSGITDMVYTLTGGGTPGAIKAINTVQEEYKKDEIATGVFSANTAEVHNYTLTLTFPETGENQNSQQGKTFSAYLQVEFAVGGTRVCYNNEHLDGYDCTVAQPTPTLWTDSCTAGSNSLNCSILADNPGYATQEVEDDTMFQSAATTNDGLWTENRAGKTEDDLPVYFYRGDIENNYVDFANKMWRIVRINEDGSVKLILGGNNATDGYGDALTLFNTSSNAAEYIDYNHANNTLRVANNTWYAENLISYNNFVADTKFCNDKSVSSTSEGNIFYGAYGRLTSKTPQYKCPNSEDNLIYKIGALTADEVSYAGGLRGQNNASYYLYDNSQNNEDTGNWWLMSPIYYYYNNAYVYSVRGPAFPGRLDVHSTNTEIYFRPTISLKSDTIKIQGDGKLDDPYVITQ